MSLSKRRLVAIIVACIQVPMLAVICFGDFGFYFPGAMGVWVDWVRWILAYLGVLVFGIASACYARRFCLAAVQVAAPIMLAAGWHLYVTMPAPHYEASEYQHLVGCSREEVTKELGRSISSGIQTDSASDGQFIDYYVDEYNGMSVLYTGDYRVVKVLENGPSNVCSPCP